jgi:hypothetical protein
MQTEGERGREGRTYLAGICAPAVLRWAAARREGATGKRCCLPSVSFFRGK